MNENPFESLHRRVVVWLSAAGGLITSCVSPAAVADAPMPLTFGEFLSLMWSMLWTASSAMILLGALIGGAVGLVYYIITFFIKRWLFKRYPISIKEIEKDLKND